MRSYFKHGSHNSICDRCGFEFKAYQLRKDWQGLMVCREDWEPRQPLDYLRVRPEKNMVDNPRPEPAALDIHICTLWGVSAYADLATADCSKADNTEFTYSFLNNLKNGV